MSTEVVEKQIASNVELHNAKLAELKAITPLEYEAASEDEKAEFDTRLSAGRAELAALKKRHEELGKEKLVELAPLQYEARPDAGLTRETEHRLRVEDSMYSDPFGYLERHVIPPISQRHGTFNFRIPFGADLAFGRPKLRVVSNDESDGGYSFAAVLPASEAQAGIGTPGIGVYGPPVARTGLMSIVSQVEVPQGVRVFQFSRASIHTDGAVPVSSGSTYTVSRADFDTQTINVQTIATITGVRREAVLSNVQFMPMVESILTGMVMRAASKQGVTGTGTAPQLNSLTSITTTQQEFDGSTNAAVNGIRALGAAHDQVEIVNGGMVTHDLIDYRLNAEFRNTRDTAGWIMDSFPSAGGRPTFLGAEIVPTSEAPGWAASTVCGYAGDFSTANCFFARQGDIVVEVSNADGEKFKTGELTVRCIIDGNFVFTIPQWFNDIARDSSA